ncbi:MAG: hypothetical protein JWQ21_1878 [Herminiimonas sp.]|nr:hypothetical protein [Herminiimonas sp.]
MNLRPIIFGIKSYIPGAIHRFQANSGGGTTSARYCYSVWLRHLAMAKINGLDPLPKVVAELGPGDSLGVGLAALISGSEKFLAFDVLSYANTEMNLKVFDELIPMFRNRIDIPGDQEFPAVSPV